ncbi:MAG: ABC transporter ATP-binding protein [bacterium]
MIQVTDLYKSFEDQDVLKGIDLTIEEGDIMALLGASGSGKSVMLRNLVGLMEPDSGSVSIDGESIHQASGRELSAVRRKIGMLFQSGALFDSMTAYENLAFPLRETTDLSEPEIRDNVSQHLSMVNMEGSDDKYPAELSGGMVKRIALARTLILNPEYIFFDEPTTGLDPLIANNILRLIKRLHNELSFTAIIVTHNFQKVFPIVQKVAMLYEGEIIAHEPPETFMESDVPAVAEFVREALEGPLEGEKT